MIELNGNNNIWDFYDKGEWIVIPTNLEINNKGSAIMGKGLAKQAVDRIPALPSFYGNMLRLRKTVEVDYLHRLILFPTKWFWRESSNIGLIEKSGKELVQLANKLIMEVVYLPRVGCGNGNLNWEDVRKVLYLDDRFIVVYNGD